MPPETPLVSVVVPVYNTEPYVAAALDSALAQTVEAIEVVVVDDGSTDGSPEIVRRFAAADRRVRVVRQDNLGLAAARNTALAAARGTYLAFLDSDDLWLPHKLERQLDVAGPDRVVFGDTYLMRDGTWGGERFSDGRGISPSLGFADLLDWNAVPVLTVLLPRALALDAGGFDPALRSVEDWDLWLRLADAGVRFVGLDEALAVYRVRPGALSSDPVWMSTWRLRVLEKLERATPASRRRAVTARRRAERHLLVGLLRQRAWQRTRQGERDDARSDLWQACRLEPRPTRLLATAVLALSDRALLAAAER